MKKLVMCSLAVIVIMAVSCQQSASSKVKAENLESAKVRDEKINLGSPIIEFDQEIYDFGTISEGDVIEGTFLVTNKGKVDLLLTEVNPSCGCTTPDWTKDPIKPGETGEIKFKFDSNGRVGNQNKSITVKSNAEQMTKVIRIKGVVTEKA